MTAVSVILGQVFLIYYLQDKIAVSAFCGDIIRMIDSDDAKVENIFTEDMGIKKFQDQWQIIVSS